MIVEMVQNIDEYLRSVCNSLQDQVSLKNVLTGEIVININVCFIEEGSAACAKN